VGPKSVNASAVSVTCHLVAPSHHFIKRDNIGRHGSTTATSRAGRGPFFFFWSSFPPSHHFATLRFLLVFPSVVSRCVNIASHIKAPGEQRNYKTGPGVFPFSYFNLPDDCGVLSSARSFSVSSSQRRFQEQGHLMHGFRCPIVGVFTSFRNGTQQAWSFVNMQLLRVVSVFKKQNDTYK